MLNLAAELDQRHLRDDAQLVEELAVRYGDVVRTFQPSTLTEVRERRRQCLATLNRHLATIHGVSQADVEAAALVRDVRVDIAAVFLPMALLLGAVAIYVSKRFHDHLSGPNRRLAYLALMLGSIGVSAAMVQGGELWANMIEMVRVGNQHMSMRGNRTPWAHNRWTIFVGGMLLFWVVSLVRFQLATQFVKQKRHEA